MDKKVSVISVVIDAVKFVLQHWSECFFRALPILLLISLASYLQHLLGGIFLATAQYVEPFLYAMFAVSWHRYSVLISERNKGGIPYNFGWREIKFGALSIVSTVGFAVLFQTLAAILAPMLAYIAFLILLIPILLTLVFIYPAIALDQPIQLRVFLNKGLKQFISFLIAFVIIGAALFALVWVINFLLPLVTTIISPNLLKILTFVVLQLVLTPIFLALMASSASFLYRDVIGLETPDNSAQVNGSAELEQDQ